MIDQTLPTLDRFPLLVYRLEEALLAADPVANDRWHGQDISSDPNLVSYELRHVVLDMPITPSQAELTVAVHPNLPWAEDHFQERVSGKPLNPAPSEAWWPYAVQGNAAHKDGQVFSHTYPERYWPKRAGDGITNVDLRGIRFRYGDLTDMLNLMQKHPLTRQAYLPVWFPEDTGATEGQRVPCSLGYHFLQRAGEIDCDYFIRSCDMIRHFRDDVYMTGRLLQFVAGVLNKTPGRLVTHIGSLHIFHGDIPGLEERHRSRKELLMEASTNLPTATYNKSLYEGRWW